MITYSFSYQQKKWSYISRQEKDKAKGTKWEKYIPYTGLPIIHKNYSNNGKHLNPLLVLQKISLLIGLPKTSEMAAAAAPNCLHKHHIFRKINGTPRHFLLFLGPINCDCLESPPMMSFPSYICLNILSTWWKKIMSHLFRFSKHLQIQSQWVLFKSFVYQVGVPSAWISPLIKGL